MCINDIFTLFHKAALLLKNEKQVISNKQQLLFIQTYRKEQIFFSIVLFPPTTRLEHCCLQLIFSSKKTRRGIPINI